ncbi:LuxR C-terminal-related transcriptional regulator [Nocardia vulneris]|uniref:LuxR C-terminal-related transcriptional regulator n=1 Tax=Nocardia vulneris TaxID=1141657 RepID=UPI0030CBDE59
MSSAKQHFMLQRAIERVRAATGASITSAGIVSGTESIVLNQISGATRAVRPINVEPRMGIAGKAVHLRRVFGVDDYRISPSITHQCDWFVLAEDLHSMVAAPVIVGTKPVAVIMASHRGNETIGGRTFDTLTAEARLIEQQLAIDAAAPTLIPSTASLAELSHLRELLRLTQADLRTLTHDIPDTAITRRLKAIADRLGAGDDRSRIAASITLSPREIDVMTLAALGHPNRSIATMLGITYQTTKSYMKSAMNKLDASSRLEAVIIARRAGIIA